MTTRLEDCLGDISAQHGILGCGLVDMSTGMVLHWAGPAELLPVAEAASDYWRLCSRQRPVFGILGAPRAQVVIHEHTRVTIVRCAEDLLLVTLTQESVAVDWAKWKQSTAEMQRWAADL